MPNKSKEVRRIQSILWYHKNRSDAMFGRQLVRWKKKFKVTDDQLIEMMNRQKDLCAVCSLPFSDGFDSMKNGTVALVPTLDHDHNCCPGEQTCGRCVRGIVHLRCNRLMGMAKDNPYLLRMCAEYLDKNK